MKRICPSESSPMRRNVSRHNAGATNGRSPSTISTMASAAQSESTSAAGARTGYGGRAGRRYLAGARGAVPRPEPDWLKYLKNSPEGSSTIMSLRRNEALYASRLR